MLRLGKPKKSWYEPQKDEEHYPGSNTGRGMFDVPAQSAMAPSTLSQEDVKDNYFTPSTLGRDTDEQGTKSQTEVGGEVTESGLPAEDEDPWGASNKLKPIDPKLYRPFTDLEWNRDMSMYSENAFSTLSLKTIKQAKKKVFDHGTIQTSDISPKVKFLVRQLQKDIDEEDLYAGEDEKGWVENGLQKLFHITILFGIKPDDLSKADDILKNMSEMPVKVIGVHYFDNEDCTAAVLKCSSTSLTKLHKKLKNALPNKHRHGEYVPHVTIAYLKKGKRLNEKTVEKIEWTIRTIDVSSPDGEIKEVATRGTKEAVRSENKQSINSDVKLYLTGKGGQMRELLLAESRNGSLNSEGTMLLHLLGALTTDGGISKKLASTTADLFIKEARLGSDGNGSELVETMLTTWGWLSHTASEHVEIQQVNDNRLVSALEKVITKVATIQPVPVANDQVMSVLAGLTAVVDKLSKKLNTEEQKPLIIEEKQQKRAVPVKKWEFSVTRDKDKLVQTVVAKKGNKKVEFNVKRGDDFLMTGISAKRFDDN